MVLIEITLYSYDRTSTNLPPHRVNSPLTAEEEGQISRVSAHWALDILYGDTKPPSKLYFGFKSVMIFARQPRDSLLTAS